MKKIYIDFETVSGVKIKNAGATRYLADEKADVLCLSIKPEGKRAKIWVPKHIEQMTGYRSEVSDDKLKKVLKEAEEVHAFNAYFEYAVFKYIMSKKYGFDIIPIERFRDTMAKAYYNTYIGSLAGVLKAMGLKAEKDAEGRKAMLKAQKEYYDKPEAFIKTFGNLAHYCKVDTELEETIDINLEYELPEKEIKQWMYTMRVNDRGVAIDEQLVGNILQDIDKEKEALLQRFNEITGDTFSPTQKIKFMDWLLNRGVEVINLQRASLEELIEKENLEEDIKEAISIRLKISSSSIKKYNAIQARVYEGRIRGNLVYYGASTGRWAGRGIQPQNLPRPTTKDVEKDLAAYKKGKKKVKDIFEDAKNFIRSVIVPKEGKKFLCADYSAIEGRVLAWIAEEKKVLKAYENGEDLYKIAAAPIFNKKPEDINKDERQIGKIVVLACGYQGSVGAFKAFGKSYGIHMEDEEIRDIVYKWRDSRKKTVSFWYSIEDAVHKAIENKKVYKVGRIKVKVDKYDNLLIKLPSGRILIYHKAFIDDSKSICFYGVNGTTRKYGVIETYGGKLTENIVQAISRDLLAYAIEKVEEDERFDTVLHIHDEILAEADKDVSVEDIESIMKLKPEWAEGLPLDAEGWEGYRYKK